MGIFGCVIIGVNAFYVIAAWLAGFDLKDFYDD